MLKFLIMLGNLSLEMEILRMRIYKLGATWCHVSFSLLPKFKFSGAYEIEFLQSWHLGKFTLVSGFKF